jgi:hypothetical protein
LLEICEDDGSILHWETGYLVRVSVIYPRLSMMSMYSQHVREYGEILE